MCTAALLTAVRTPGARTRFCPADPKCRSTIWPLPRQDRAAGIHADHCGHCAPFADVLDEYRRSMATRWPCSRGQFERGQCEFRGPVHLGSRNYLPDSVRRRPDGVLVHAKHALRHAARVAIDAGGTIQNDWTYNLLTRDIFEGNGLMPEIDSLLSGKADPRRPGSEQPLHGVIRSGALLPGGG